MKECNLKTSSSSFLLLLLLLFFASSVCRAERGKGQRGDDCGDAAGRGCKTGGRERSAAPPDKRADGPLRSGRDHGLDDHNDHSRGALILKKKKKKKKKEKKRGHHL
jgi:hypothetical protein